MQKNKEIYIHLNLCEDAVDFMVNTWIKEYGISEDERPFLELMAGELSSELPHERGVSREPAYPKAIKAHMSVITKMINTMYLTEEQREIIKNKAVIFRVLNPK